MITSYIIYVSKKKKRKILIQNEKRSKGKKTAVGIQY